MTTEKPQLVDTGRGFTLQWGGRMLASSYFPQKKAQDFASKITLEERTLYILAQPLFGYGVEILKDRLPANSFLLCIEINQEIFSVCSQHFDLTLRAPDSLEYLRTDTASLLIPLINKLGLWRFRRCKLISLSSNILFQDLYQNLHSDLENHIIRYWKNRMTQIQLGDRWVNNIIRNIPYIHKNESFPKTDKPILICGAGSSLNQILPDLKEQRSEFYILAVDTAWKTLSAQQIEPDAVVNLDGQFYNYLDFYHQSEEVLLLCDLTAYPASIRDHRCCFFLSQFCDSPFLENIAEEFNLPLVEPLGSVGLLTYQLANMISDGPIIFAGMDFAYIPGQSHGKESIFHQLFLNQNQRMSPYQNFLESSYKKGLIQSPELSNGWYTNSQLLSYHKDFVTLLAGSEKSLLEWNPQGLNNHLPSFDGNPVALNKPNTIEKGENNQRDFSDSWLDLRLIELKEIHRLWQLFQDNQISAITLKEHLLPLDYLYLAIPHNPPFPGEKPEELVPIVKKAQKYLKIIERIA